MDHAEYSYDAKSKQTTTKTSTTLEQKDLSPPPPSTSNRRHARLITNVPLEQSEEDQPETPTTPNAPPKESYDDSARRFQRLREIRKNLRNKYDDHSHPQLSASEQTLTSSPSSPSTSSPKKPDDRPQSVHIPVERITPNSTDPGTFRSYQRTATQMDIRDRRYRSRTLEVNQTRSVDNQIYGSSASKAKDHTIHRSDSHRHRHPRLSFRRSSEDTQDKQSQFRRHYDATRNSTDEIWFDIGQEHWTNLLEHGWRPTSESSGVQLVSLIDSGRIFLREGRVNG